jgi:hypothetical protein
VVTVFFNQKGNKMATPFPNPEQKTLLFNMLKVLGGHRVIVNFAGGGDSGDIDAALLLDQYEKEIDCTGITIEWTKRISSARFNQAGVGGYGRNKADPGAGCVA